MTNIKRPSSVFKADGAGCQWVSGLKYASILRLDIGAPDSQRKQLILAIQAVLWLIFAKHFRP